ncbi:MAG TPA: hypothetical protein V6C81_27965 [Planktothrix sp.]|jgi:hypothetical protein
MTTKLAAVRNSVIAGALLLAQSFCVTPLAVLADSSVRVAGQSVFNVPPGSISADTVQNNLDNALVATKDRSPNAVSVVYAKGMPVVTLGGFQVATIDAASAKAANTSPALLAKQWADALRSSMQDQASVDSYVAQLSGGAGGGAPSAGGYPGAAPNISNAEPGYSPPQQQYQPPQSNGGYAQTPPPQGQQFYGAGAPQYGGPGQGPGFRQGRVAVAPQGLTFPVSLQTSISTQVAKTGDMIEAQLSQPVILGDAQIPAGSTVMGTITDAEAGKRLSRSGSLTIKFNRLRTPDGIETPISAHLVGGIGKYQQTGSDESGNMRGEGWKAKLGQTAIRGGLGAGLGAGLGTAVGAIAGGGRGAGMGAWSGTAIGGGMGAADMLLRKGRDVTIPSGTAMQLQLDAPATVAGGGPQYTGNL